MNTADIRKIIINKGKDIEEELIAIRRDIHSHPEFGFNEYRTTELIQRRLNDLGLEVRIATCGTGVIGILRGGKKGRTILLRADIDCLKIEEKSDSPYKSQNIGFMHACGHDAHTAWLLGAAEILMELQDEIPGNIKFVFQPAEENGGGALNMIEDGVLKNPKVDAVLGAHIWPTVSAGKIAVKDGPLMAATDFFSLTIKGKGAHGAQPQRGIDPIAIGCLIYSGFQNIITRCIDPLDPAVLTVGKFISGSGNNIIPDSALLEGTVRTFSDSARKKIPRVMENLIKGITIAYGAEYEFNYNPYHTFINNDIKITHIFEESVKDLLGGETLIIPDKGDMAGEDFSAYQQYVPGTFFWVGTKNEEKGINKMLHSNDFDIDESVISLAAESLAYAAIENLFNI